MTAELRSEIVAAVLANSIERCRRFPATFARPAEGSGGDGTDRCVRAGCNRQASTGALCVRHLPKSTRWTK